MKRGYSFYAGRQRNRLASFDDLSLMNSSNFFKPITPSKLCVINNYLCSNNDYNNVLILYRSFYFIVKNVPAQGQDCTRLCMILDDYLEGDTDNAGGFYISPFKQNLNILEKYFKRREFQKGAVLYDIGRSSRYLYLIEEGSVEILSSEPVERVQKLSSGAIFGESEFLLQKPYRYGIYNYIYTYI